ncbi:unnamed protein product [Ixodes hexagonus]
MPTSQAVIVQSRHRRYSCNWAQCLCCMGFAAGIVGTLSYVSKAVYLYPSCETPNCWDFTAALYSSLNYTISPCENFYHFVCDGWKASKAAEAFVFSDLQMRVVSAAVNSLLRLGKAPMQRQTAVQKASVMFKTCLQVLAGSVDSSANLKSFLKSVNLLAPRSETADVLDVVVDLGLNWNVPVFFQITIEPDYMLDGRQTLYFARSRHLMDWFLRRSRLSGRTLRNYIVACSEFIGRNVNPEALILFENYLMSTLGATSETSRVTETIEMSALESRTPGLMSSDWLDVLNRHLPEPSQLLMTDTIKVTDTKYLQSVSEVILDDRRRRNGDLLTYVAWLVVDYLGPLTSFTLVAPAFLDIADVRNQIFTRCFEEVNSLMPYAFGEPFAVQSVPPDAREEVFHMVQQVKTSLKQSFLQSKWMDNATSRIALLKLHSMRTIIAYPDFVLGGLNDYYAYMPDAGLVFLESRLKSWFVTMRARKDDLWKRKSPGYDFRLTDVNAFYQPLSNTMIIPAGIINSPFFHAKYPVSINFGGLGHVIAHEIIHGFDVDSSRRDVHGEIHDWWSPETRSQYEQRVRCLKRSYSNFKADLHSQDSAISEDIADSAGLAQAHKAYRALDRGNLATETTLLKSFTPDQAFYVMSCFKWCSNRRTSGKGYSTDELRCNVPLKNIPDFARAFGCRRNDPMNPAHKCKFW